MSRVTRYALASLGLLAGLLAAGAALPATYRGRDLDGRRYQASILNQDHGLIDNVEVKFHDEHAYVYLRGGWRLVLILQDEEITDPHHIPADDLRHGITWEINLKEQIGR